MENTPEENKNLEENLEVNENGNESEEGVLNVKFSYLPPWRSTDKKQRDLPTVIVNEYMPFKKRRELVDSIVESEDLNEKSKREQLAQARDHYIRLSTANYGSTCIDGPSRGFEQHPEIAGHVIDNGIREFQVKGRKKLTGLKAVQALNASLGYGSRNKVNLWHSGITLEVGNFKPLEFLQLIIGLQEKRLELGYRTLGSIFNAEDSIITSILVDYILEHVITCNLEDDRKEVILDYMKPADVPLLINAMLGSIYSNGYPVITQCRGVLTGACEPTDISSIIDTETNRFNIDKMLDFNRLQWTDVPRFDVKDAAIINAPDGSVKTSDLDDWNKRHNNQKLIVEVEEGELLYKFFGCQPNLTTSFKEGDAWVNEVKERVSALSTSWSGNTKDEREARREREIKRFSKLLSAQRNVSWINKITVSKIGSNDELVIDEREEIKECLETQLVIDNYKVVESAIAELKDSYILSLIASTNWKCPKCGHGQNVEGSKYPSLVPLNIIQYFFNIGEWKQNTPD